MVVTFSGSLCGIPAVVFDLPEELSVVAHHFCSARCVMIECDETAVSKLVFPGRKGLWQDVSVDVDLLNCHWFGFGFG
jgi:hypothetical protein